MSDPRAVIERVLAFAKRQVALSTIRRETAAQALLTSQPQNLQYWRDEIEQATRRGRYFEEEVAALELVLTGSPLPSHAPDEALVRLRVTHRPYDPSYPIQEHDLGMKLVPADRVASYRPSGLGAPAGPVDELTARLRLLTDEDRRAVLASVCPCGSTDPLCRCWDDS